MTTTLYPALAKLLRQYGCVLMRQGKGSHEIWYSPLSQKNFSVPFTIKAKPTANAIIKQAGIEQRL